MKEKSPKFVPSGLNSQFEYGPLSFNAYVEYMRNVIEKTRTDLHNHLHEIIIDANSPFEWRPENHAGKHPITGKIRCGILLVHGLFDSPYSLLSLAEYYRANDYLVRAILLPGHGTNPGDLIGIEFHEWLKAVQYGINSFQGEVENLFLLGHSTGGTLVLHQALIEKITNLKGIILFAPAVKLLPPIALISNIDKLLRATPAPGIRSGIHWLSRSKRHDYAKYLSFPLEAVHQVKSLAKRARKLLVTNSFDFPIFLIATGDDEVLSTRAMLQLMQENTHPDSRMIFYANQPIPSLFAEPRIEQRASNFAEQRILNFSHICLSIAPNHPHYGKNASYQDFLHYEDGFKKRPNVDKQTLFYGAITRSNLRRYLIQRLTYNPDFTVMAGQLLNWTENLAN